MNQTLYTIVDDIKRIINVDCSVWNFRGRCLASTSREIESVQEAVEILLSMNELETSYITSNTACFLVTEDEEDVLVFAIHEIVDNVKTVGQLCVSQIIATNRFHEKRIDRNRFVQQLLLDNLLLVDIYGQARKMHLNIEERRVVFVVEPKRQRDDVIFETLKGMYEETADFVTSIDEGHFVLVKTLEPEDGYEEVHEEALAIADVLQTEAMTDVKVAYGTIVDELKDVSKSYKEASIALDVGSIFYKEKRILAYNELGIGRLIHQLPMSLCEMFLEEVFNGNALEQFDEETLATVNAFFANNLNISETARQMYLHRNTLGYRLDKIMKTTGLDVKKFDDALTFKIALMVSAHMKFIRTQE
jgi:carbohydrate diacid regulator